MKIAILNENFSSLTETFIYQHIISLTKSNHDVTVITLKRINSIDRPFDSVIIIPTPSWINPFYWVKYDPIWLFKRLVNRLIGGRTIIAGYDLFKFYYRKKLKEILKKNKPDVIQAEFGPMGWLMAPVAEHLNIPLIISFHGYDATSLLRNKYWFKRYTELWKIKGIFTTPSGYIRDCLIDAGAPESKIIVIRNGISTEHWKNSNPKSHFDGKNIYYLFVGRLIEKKGPLQLIEAFNVCKIELNGRFIPHLLICGSGPLEKNVINKIKNLNLENDIKLLGKCSHDSVKRLMAKAHVYVQHSVKAINGDCEGLPVSITEAAASGLPIISTRHSGIPEIVKEGENGFLVEENDYVAMGKLMANIACNFNNWETMGIKSRKIIENEYSQESITRQFTLLLHSLNNQNFP